MTASATATLAPSPGIKVGYSPGAVTLPSGGKTAYVVDSYASPVSFVSTATRHVYPPITVGSYPVAVAIAP
ncbi:MAG: hypothetical protein ACYCST_17710 [Acidimicrobiales bacterium]